jgi:drug/metabolite transporter (DMT)-like permease
MNFETIVTAGGTTAAIVQGIKWLWRKFVAKNMLYEFPAWFYALSVPVLNILVVPLLAIVGFTGFAMPTDWTGWVQNIIQVLIGTVISFVTYNEAIRPFNVYRAELAAK